MEKPQGKSPLRRTRHNWEANINEHERNRMKGPGLD